MRQKREGEGSDAGQKRWQTAQTSGTTGNLNASNYSIWNGWHIPQVLEYDYVFLTPLFICLFVVWRGVVVVLKLNARPILSTYGIFTTAFFMFRQHETRGNSFFLFTFFFFFSFFSYSSCLTLIFVMYVLLLQHFQLFLNRDELAGFIHQFCNLMITPKYLLFLELSSW